MFMSGQFMAKVKFIKPFPSLRSDNLKIRFPFLKVYPRFSYQFSLPEQDHRTCNSNTLAFVVVVKC